MAVIGELIKKAIDFTGIVSPDPEPIAAQRKVLKDLLKKARLTAFGKHHNFTGIIEKDDFVKAFQQNVPIHDYDALFEKWWHYLLDGHQNVTWPGGQQYFALSSGTTSNSKYIPITDEMLESIKRAGIQQVLALKNFNMPGDFFEKQIVMLGSSTKLIEKEDHFEGEISGISASQLPSWFQGYYKPGIEISSIPEWDERVRRIAEEAPKWDIGGISGIPSWVELMLKEIIRFNKLETIHDIWPNLAVYTSGGVAFEPYRSSFEKLVKNPLVYIDTYLCSEGYLATQKRPDTDAMALLTDNGVFFEFVPFKDENIDEEGRVKQDAEVHTLENAKEGIDYVLLLSSVAGSWRYMIGDTVTITDLKRAEIKITGRTKHYLNVVGEQLAVHQMNEAIQAVASKFNLDIKEFTLAAIRRDDGEYINKWYIGANDQVDETELAKFLDETLGEANKNYKVARGKALKGIETCIIPTEHFYSWSEEYKKLGGQVKIPRVMKEKDFREFEAYIKGL